MGRDIGSEIPNALGKLKISWRFVTPFAGQVDGDLPSQ